MASLLSPQRLSDGPSHTCAASLFLCQQDVSVASIVLAAVNVAAVPVGVHVSFQTTFFCGYMPRSGSATFLDF